MGTPFVHELRVRYGECDPQGIVFNANYLLYFDVAFTELWREAVGPVDEMNERGIDVVVAEAHLGFRAPARYDDVLALRARGDALGATSITTAIDVRAGRRGAGGGAPAPRLRRARHVGQDRAARLGAGRARAARPYRRRSRRRAGGRRNPAWPSAALTVTSATSEARFAAPSTFSARLARAESAEASGAGVLPSSSGTAPPGAERAKRTPTAAEARPVATTAATAPSLAVARTRSRPERLPGRASPARAPAQPATTAAVESEFTVP